MKSILYVGATLMIGAGIYGFADYKKTTHNREFKSLYTETEPTTQRIKNAAPVTTLAEPQKLSKEIEVKQPVPKLANENIEKKSKAHKKLNYKQFSRAPLREVELPK